MRLSRILICSLGIALVGCQNTPVPQPEIKSPPAQPVSPLVHHIIFFEFDEATLPENIDALVKPHVRYLIQNPTQRLLIEGGADETGPFEHNTNLGLQRANAVASSFRQHGISDEQLIVRSISIVRPLNTEKQPHSLPRNRRVTLVY